ncbi:class I SAM-dependent methyltransferase [Actinomyces vulturis]|uniref:class I SAM-dependent methyltransferase n=1 Tax=Actinomyces vulturis TaxID=1857645 RepID=UPI0008314EA9|nr:class I SAM-dependent methyltransferase [Actinomyces vulturis]
MDITSFAPLLTSQGWHFLQSLPPYGSEDPLTLATRLRANGHCPDLISAALTQLRLRAKAEEKFGPFAQSMLFTPDAVEQATRLSVAARHAQRFAQSGCTKVADAGCGIGGESMALAGMDIPVLAIERDEATAALATINLMPFPHAEVICDDALNVDYVARGVDGLFSDPARRSKGRRITDPESWQPALSQVLALRKQVPNLGIKVAPGIDYSALPEGSHVQWVSVAGDLLEADIWCGALANEGPGRSALLIDREGRGSILRDESVTDPSTPPVMARPANDVGRFLFEPDDAVVRAGLVSYLGAHLGAAPVDAQIAYLTGDKDVPEQWEPFVQTFEILEVLPTTQKKIAAWVRSHDVGQVEIKKRGVDIDPTKVRKSLPLKGSESLTLIYTRLSKNPDMDPATAPRGKSVVIAARRR